MDYRADPAYAEGFYDALDFAPLFDDATEPYKAGWNAAWESKRIFAEAGFSQQGFGFEKKMTVTSDHRPENQSLAGKMTRE